MAEKKNKEKGPCVKWDESMMIGHPVIDMQHKRLVDEIACLCEEIKKPNIDEECVKKHIRFLLEYAKEHFRTEEEIMKNMGYSGYLEHYNAHRWFEKQAKKLVEDYLKYGASPMILRRIQHLLIDWLLSHILGMDQRMGHFIGDSSLPV